ncbi:MAG TPA: hypothetical protein VIV40_16120 [Kofleriaceae bacterium]
MRTWVIVATLTCASSVYADELTEDPARSPGFVDILRQDANSRAGGELTYFFIDGGDATLWRVDLHGHYVDPNSGFGGYAQIPITHVDDNNNSDTVLGGLEVGGLYIPKLSTPNVGLVLRAGLALPTVDNDDSALIGFLSSYMRPTDLYSQLPRAASLLLSASPMIRSGNFFARIDLGLDLNVYVDQGDTVDPGLLVNVGAGFDAGTAAIMGELSTLVVTGDNGDSLTSAALSVRFDAGSVQPYLALLLPVDNDVSDIFDAAIVVGIEGRL